MKIKSVDFKIEAKGAGVVNWNGSFSIWNNVAGQSVSNHSLPKLRGVDPMRLKAMNDEALSSSHLIISQNCIRHELFRNETSGLKSVNISNVLDVLCSITGLVRGYVIADKDAKLSLKRKSSLLLEDFVDTQAVGSYEQFSNSGERNETSIFSKYNFGETTYTAYGSINIEDLQFIPLEDSLGRGAYRDIITKEEGLNVAEKITEFLKSLDFSSEKNPLATFETNYVRIGSIMKSGEAGILLNEDAIDLIVKEMLDRIENFSLRQSKGHVNVTSLEVDYNAGRAMRIKYNPSSVENNKSAEYEVYYKNVEISDIDFKLKNDKTKDLKDTNRKNKVLEEKKKAEAKKAKEEQKAIE